MREWREERGQGVVHKPIPGCRVRLSNVDLSAVRGTSLNASKSDSSANSRRTGRAGATYRDKIWRDAMSE